MRVIVCGSRNWTDGDRIADRLERLPEHGLTIIQGGARGADSIARGWALEAGVDGEEFTALWDEHGRKAGPIRNQEMLDAGADLVLAFRSAGASRGTDHMVSIARRRGVPVEVHNALSAPEEPEGA